MTHEGFTLWFSGLSGAGKTTIAVALEEKLRARGLRIERPAPFLGVIGRRNQERELQRFSGRAICAPGSPPARASER